METVGDGENEDDLPVSPLRAQRESLYGGLNALQVAASAIGTAERRLAIAALDSALRYAQDQLLPACRAEEAVIFPAVDSLLGVSNACHAMKAQHTTIIRMTGDLAQAIEAAKVDISIDAYGKYLHPLLYGLYALVRAHLESEDEAYIGLLEAVLSEVQVAAIADAFGVALAGARMASPEAE